MKLSRKDRKAKANKKRLKVKLLLLEEIQKHGVESAEKWIVAKIKNNPTEAHYYKFAARSVNGEFREIVESRKMD